MPPKEAIRSYFQTYVRLVAIKDLDPDAKRALARQLDGLAAITCASNTILLPRSGDNKHIRT